MASEVDICNLALAHLGDAATVASLDPPEGSPQSEHCARFYPVARDSLLEMHSWGFATRRKQLAQVSNPWPEWAYAYAMPSDAVNILAILPVDAADDNNIQFPNTALVDNGGYAPQPFIVEAGDSGVGILYTNVPNAVLRYTAIVTDPTEFSPLFTVALSWHLASMLAGPILKGEAGATESKRCTGMMQSFLTQAKNSDANQRRLSVQHTVGWMRERGGITPGNLIGGR